MNITITNSTFEDLEELLTLQKRAFRSEAVRYNNCNIHPLRQTLEEIRMEFAEKLFLKALIDGMLAGSVRAALSHENRDTCFIEKLFVAPEFQKRGIGFKLLESIQSRFPEAKSFELATGKDSPENIRLYERAGFRIYKEVQHPGVTLVFMRK